MRFIIIMVLYAITCKCGAKYIGETGKRLIDRKKDHIGDVKYYKESLPLVKHLLLNNKCSIDFQGIKVIGHENDFIKRKILEADIIEKEKIKRDKFNEHKCWFYCQKSLVSD